jgi:predicted MFS family arabinose efflux permease
LDSNATLARGNPDSSFDPAEQSIRHVPASLLALMILTQFASALTLTVTSPLLAAMADDLLRPGSSPYMIKLVTGIVAPALIFGAPLAGWLSDRFDRRPLLVAFGTAFIISATAPAFLDSVEAIVISRFFAGATSGALGTIGMTMVGYYYDAEKRPSVIGILAFLTLSTSILALPIAGALAATGWRNAFFLFLALTPLVLLALVRPLPAPAREPASGARGSRVGGWPRIPLALLLMSVMSGLALNLAGIFYSFYFTELGVKNVSTISFLLMYQAVVGGIMTLLYGRVAKRLSSKSIFIVCLACAALGLGTQGLTTDWRIAGASLTLTGIAMGWFVANISTTTIALVDEHHRGAALGIVRAIGAIATLLGISQPIQTALGIQGIFLTVAALSVLLLVGLATGALPLRRVEPRR